jgi:CBS domain-containing protein
MLKPSTRVKEMTDPADRIGRLESARKVPVHVRPSTSLREAVTIMMAHDYSQLPIMTTSRDVKGLISWKTIGRKLALKKPCSVASDCMGEVDVVSIDASLFAAISKIAEHDCVLVQANDKTVCGIVTAADLSYQFGRLAEPFLMIGEIEDLLRRLLHDKFTEKELNEFSGVRGNSKSVDSVADLTLGDIVHLVSSEDRWERLHLEVDRVEFVSRLDGVRVIRNEVMHFTPGGLEGTKMAALREFAKFLQLLSAAGAL